MIINHNMMAQNSHRMLSVNAATMGKSTEKLSSGLRINRAADDAAGLSISEKMRGQIRGLYQASRNAQDGISVVQTAEGALDEAQSILQTMREKAVASANDSNVTLDRAAIQAQVTQLTDELDRIATTTQFNTMNLLDGTFTDKVFHVGANKDQSIQVNIEAMSAKGLQLRGGVPLTAAEVTDKNAEIKKLTSLNAPLQGSVSKLTGSVALLKGTLAKIQGTLAKMNSTMAKINGTIAKMQGTLAKMNEAVEGIQKTMAPKVKSVDQIKAKLAQGSLSATEQQTLNERMAKLEGSIATHKTSISTKQGSIAVKSTSIATKQGSVSTKNQSIVTKQGSIATKQASIKGKEDTLASKQAELKTNNQKIAQLQAELAVTDPKEGIKVDTQANANVAIKTIDDALTKVSAQRSQLGAIQNRMEHTIKNLNNAEENLQSSESRIRDIDMAREMSEFTKKNILTQASQAMLAQANQLPQQVLQLLR